ncbi:carbohydrate ABC transporter membrane protein 1, CUT1 family [Paenibacillus sp. UNCCL117]|uniref:ABC transporter permease n=1 Tax=unclassified Paenibacillus TaxID=185978 RepID=UPI00088F7925|nr:MULTISPECIES: ABC transporter permease subunit [unclassified Paenibacillus]SDE25414.1 putative aldouronate transport system permease protein [Paenibacillus sp. cl123]SFW62414.1 carbohydrate ABC transporter membrane protein 1, CUT1 family [Paenibacillus sp. UNCCL117]
METLEAKERGMAARHSKKSEWLSYLKLNYDMYLLLLPGLVFILIFNYLPLYGITLAFKDFDMFAGSNPFMSIVKSPWVGLEHFENVFGRADFRQVLGNTLLISVYKLIFLFPLPVLLAIMLNELRIAMYKKLLQTILYLPHFLSWAVVSGIFVTLLGSTGVVNQLLTAVAGTTVNFLMDTSVFRSVLVVTDGWKEIGWSSIIYLAAITGIDQEQYEAATVDGATKLQKIWYITIPGIAPTILLLLILKIGHILDAGFEQIFIMYNPVVYEVADIIGTYVYRMGLGQMNFSLGTAVGLFNSVVAFILIVSANAMARKFMNKGIW